MGLVVHFLSIQKRNLMMITAFGLTIVLMLAPTAYAMTVSVASDRIGDEFIMNAFTGDIIKYVDLGDIDYISFADLINVRICLSEETMFATLHVLGKIPSNSTEDVNFAFGIIAGPSEDSFGEGFAPTEYPWFLVQVLYTTEPTMWRSWLYIAITPDDADLHHDMPFTIKNKQISISVPTSLLPMTTFGWRGLTSYQNTTLRDNSLTLNDLTNVNCLS